MVRWPRGEVSPQVREDDAQSLRDKVWTSKETGNSGGGRRGGVREDDAQHLHGGGGVHAVQVERRKVEVEGGEGRGG